MEQLNEYYRRALADADRRYASRLEGSATWMYRVAKALRPVTHNLRAVRDTVQVARQYGAAAAAYSNVSPLRQVAQQVRLHQQNGIAGEQYYLYMLYSRPEEARFYVHGTRLWMLLEWLSEAVSPADVELLCDKKRFHDHGTAHGLSVIPVYAVLTKHEVTWVDALRDEVDAKEDLFSKPVDGFKGKGAQHWPKVNGGYRGSSGEALALDDLLRMIGQEARWRAQLLQPYLVDHASLRHLTGFSLLSRARIVTYRAPSAQAALLEAHLGISIKDVAVSSTSDGGSLVAPIDLHTGRLGGAINRVDPARIMERVATHPGTGHSITGYQLPDWDAAVDLVLRAHDTLPSIPFVGWDVGFTDSGPVLIEGNVRWGGTSTQAAPGVPLGKTPFVKVFNDIAAGV